MLLHHIVSQVVSAQVSAHLPCQKATNLQDIAEPRTKTQDASGRTKMHQVVVTG